MSTLLRISNLKIGYHKDKPLLLWENYSLGKGKLVALTGLNGTGKTTAFKTLLSDIPALSGEIYLGEKNHKTLNAQDTALLVSVVLTRQPVFSELTVHDLLALGRHPYLNRFGNYSEKDKDLINQTLTQLNLQELHNKKLNEISDGQLQKVFLGRALTQDTPLILMDEPTSYLDWVNKNEMILLLKDVVQTTGKSILFSSHDIPLLTEHADEILAITEGRIHSFNPVDFKNPDLLNHLFKTSFFK